MMGRFGRFFSKAFAIGCAMVGAAGPALSEGGPPPSLEATLPKVVSMNLCTDQIAMLLAGEGQLLSISHLASDPRSSPMAAEAVAYRSNRGQAEQIFLMSPDIVLAGSYTANASVQLLQSLGLEVVVLPPVAGLDEVTPQIRVIAKAMQREAAGEALIASFEAGLAALEPPHGQKRAALYYPNGFTVGEGSLSHDLLSRSGFENIGAGAGIWGGGQLPLERLVMASPDVVITAKPYPGASRAEELLEHPALRALPEAMQLAPISDADWVCGTPYLLRALKGLHELHHSLAVTKGAK